MRFILDTSVLVASMRSRHGASAAILKAVEASHIRLAASPALFLEYEAVLKREIHGLTAEQVDVFLDGFVKRLEPVEIRFQWRPLLTDADDELVIEAAINAQAFAIVTHNKRDFDRAADRFGIRIFSPGQALETLRRLRAIP